MRWLKRNQKPDSPGVYITARVLAALVAELVSARAFVCSCKTHLVCSVEQCKVTDEISLLCRFPTAPTKFFQFSLLVYQLSRVLFTHGEVPLPGEVPHSSEPLPIRSGHRCLRQEYNPGSLCIAFVNLLYNPKSRLVFTCKSCIEATTVVT